MGGEFLFQFMVSVKHSVGKTAGQPLDALTTQLGETEFNALLVISAREQCKPYKTNSIVQW